MSDTSNDKFWFLHIVGPDDLIPQTDELTALREANAVNARIEKERRANANDPNWPFSIAIVRTAEDVQAMEEGEE